MDTQHKGYIRCLAIYKTEPTYFWRENPYKAWLHLVIELDDDCKRN